jgi:hypothetical protein
VIFDEVSDPLSTTIGSLDITVNGWQQFVDGQNETKFGMLIVGKFSIGSFNTKVRLHFSSFLSFF